MKKLLIISFCLLIGFTQSLFAQSETVMQMRREYIEKYKHIAVKEMVSNGVPASITLAQGILESGCGKSELATKANNHFGIKCQGVWEGPTYRYDDDAKNECFRKYTDAHASYKDHSYFLRSRDRYSGLFKLETTDYKGWAKGLKAAGYATNPQYAELLIKIIDDMELSKFDYMTQVPEVNYASTSPKDGIAKPENKPVTTTAKPTWVPATIITQTVQIHNDIKFIRAQKGDDFNSIAQKFNQRTWQILKYNDLKPTDKIKEGDTIYLQPKRNKAMEDYYLVRKGDDMRVISQRYGVKLTALYKKNNMEDGDELIPGTKIYIKKKKRD